MGNSSGLMWPWLQAWIALSLGIVWAGAIYFVAIAIVAHGQPPFTADDKYMVSRAYPGGTFIDDRTYKFCDGSFWILVDSEWNKAYTGRACVRIEEDDLP